MLMNPPENCYLKKSVFATQLRSQYFATEEKPYNMQ